MNSSRDWLNRLGAVECRDSTFHQMEPPLVLAKASGPWMWDVDGRRYLDLCAGFGVLALGHNSAPVREVLTSFLNESEPPILHGTGDVYPSAAKVTLLETLRAQLPDNMSVGTLALSGGQAVEIAVKTAILSREKTGFICFDDSYHGLDLGILPLTARQDFRQPFVRGGASITVVRLPYGKTDKAQFMNAVQSLEAEGSGFAAVVVEPIQGRGGMIEAPSGWLAAIADWTHSAGGLVIFDEILTGLGRSGRMTTADAVPADLLCLGKALGGGFPLSACFGSKEAMGAWPESRGEAIHTGTFFGHPLSCSVATAVIKAIVRQGLPERARQLGMRMKETLGDVFHGVHAVTGVTGAGMMLAIHFRNDGAGAELMERARAEGIIAIAGGARGQCLTMTPPLTLDIELWEAAVRTLRTLV